LKVVILAGGYGTRLNEETKEKPKPLVEIGQMPILWHIMKNYSFYKINDFVICAGYKQEKIKEYFLSKFEHKIIIEKSSYIQIKIIQKNTDPWMVTVVDTGLETMTGGRLKKVKDFVNNETFCFTYGDTLNDMNIKELINFHKNSEGFVTVTACQPPGKFGILDIKDNKVIQFMEKPKGDGNWVNGGYFVLEPTIFDYIDNDATVWEQEPLQKLTKEGQISAFKHHGFYQPMDTMYEKEKLEKMWILNNAKWKVWK
jgi:glucose-1-phosphate cytidylyltransferase